MSKNYDGARKAVSRTRIFGQLRPASTLVSLPGMQLICVREMIHRKIIDRRTRNFWIENDKNKIRPMQNAVESLALRFDAPPQIIHAEVTQWVPPVGIDLLNLDMEESFKPPIGKWLEREVAPKLSRRSQVVLTFITYSRHALANDFMTWFGDYCNSDPLLRRLRDHNILDKLNHYDPHMANTAMLLACALNIFDVQFTLFDKYKDRGTVGDGYPMVTFLLDLNRLSHAPVLPSFTSIYRSFEQKYLPSEPVVGWGKSGHFAPPGNRLDRGPFRAAATELLREMRPLPCTLEYEGEDIVLRLKIDQHELARGRTIDEVRANLGDDQVDGNDDRPAMPLHAN